MPFHTYIGEPRPTEQHNLPNSFSSLRILKIIFIIGNLDYWGSFSSLAFQNQFSAHSGLSKLSSWLTCQKREGVTFILLPSYPPCFSLYPSSQGRQDLTWVFSSVVSLAVWLQSCLCQHTQRVVRLQGCPMLKLLWKSCCSKRVSCLIPAKPSWMIQGYKTTSLCHPSPFCLHLSHAISLSFPCLRHSSCPTFNHNILLLQVHILLGSQGCNILGNIFQELVAALAGSCISCAQSLLTAQHCCLLFFLSLCRFFPGHWDFNFPSVVMTGSLLS